MRSAEKGRHTPPDNKRYAAPAHLLLRSRLGRLCRCRFRGLLLGGFGGRLLTRFGRLWLLNRFGWLSRS